MLTRTGCILSQMVCVPVLSQELGKAIRLRVIFGEGISVGGAYETVKFFTQA